MPEDIRADAEAALAEFCRVHSSADVADQLRYEYEVLDSSALLKQARPSFLNASSWASNPVAKFRYSQAKNVWTLYWADSNEKWHRVSSAKAAPDIRTLLAAVLDDPSGVFWG